MVSRDKECIKKIHTGTLEIKNKMAEMKKIDCRRKDVWTWWHCISELCVNCVHQPDTYVIGVPTQEELGMKNIWRTMSVKKKFLKTMNPQIWEVQWTPKRKKKLHSGTSY